MPLQSPRRPRDKISSPALQRALGECSAIKREFRGRPACFCALEVALPIQGSPGDDPSLGSGREKPSPSCLVAFDSNPGSGESQPPHLAGSLNAATAVISWP